jgi:hypothetical protein
MNKRSAGNGMKIRVFIGSAACIIAERQLTRPAGMVQLRHARHTCKKFRMNTRALLIPAKPAQRESM